MMLWVRPTVSHGSANLLLRVQRPCTSAECADSSVERTLTQLFAPSWALGGLREVGLTGGPLPIAPSWAPIVAPLSSSPTVPNLGSSPTVHPKEGWGSDFDDEEALEVLAFERLDSMECMLIASFINCLPH